MPKISIVIPAYNAQNVLTETLNSVLEQTLADWELVIVDDGSMDGTFQLASGYANEDLRIRVVRQENQGVAAARNFGMSQISAASESVIFLDHDDLWRQDALATLYSALMSNPSAVGAHGLGLLVETEARGRQFTSHEGSTVDWRRRKLIRSFGVTRTVDCTRTEPTTFNVQVYDGCVCTPGLMLIRRTALDRLGQFDSTIVPCDDWDMWVRLSLLGDVAFIDEILLNWCVYGGNASLNKEGMGHGVSQIRRKMFLLPGMTSEQRYLAHTRYRRMFSSVERCNSKDCAAWALQVFGLRHYAAAFQYAKLSVSLYVTYIYLVLFWGRTLDRGPIPRRLKDTSFPLVLQNLTRSTSSKNETASDISSHTLL
jgi:glycosyltransferase involved in cell wall biosynthesis